MKHSVTQKEIRATWSLKKISKGGITVIKSSIIMCMTAFLAVPGLVVAKENPQQWTLVNPAGVVLSKPVKIVERPSTLEGKTVVLRWNGKPNGDVFLNRVAELLNEKVKDVKVVKAWEVAPETNIISYSPDKSVVVAKKLVSLKPDIVIGAPAD